MKKLAIIFACLLVFTACNNEETAEVEEEKTEVLESVNNEEEAVETSLETTIITLEELAKYDGQDGMPAYVAIDGVVYDVTDHEQWKTGSHGGQTAGTDISSVFPHTDGRELNLPIVGLLDDGIEAMSIEELAKYNGQDGMPAYIAIDGVVYDVSESDAWTSGSHGGQMAGTDVSATFPHTDGREKIFPIVGILTK